MSSEAILIIVVLLLGITAGISNHFFNRSIDFTIEQDPRALAAAAAAEAYLGLRDQALKTTLVSIGDYANSDAPYGLVVDWNTGSGVVTVVALCTGEASMYLSSGGGILGGGQYARVNQLAKELVSDAKQFPRNSSLDEKLPESGQVKFHFLQASGVSTTLTNIEDLEHGTLLTSYFDKVNLLIKELRNLAATEAASQGN